ncbi:MAG TPA: endo-1,4-beta-xylanase [Gemmatimonadaceae bacterium]|nr:endo-1,4-beta-xylanase [Gemmatimonadaceae bacterium]
MPSFRALPISLVLTLAALVPAAGQQQDTAILAKVTPQAIASRIDRHRMGDLVVKTRPGATVRIEQVRHEFLFGTAIPNALAESSPDAMTPAERRQYLDVLVRNFNYAVHENALKWYDNEKQRGVVDYAVADRIWRIADSLRIPMRGHTVYWEKEEFLMPWLRALPNDSLRKAVRDRAVSLINHYEGRIDEFDLNNEMLHGDFFRRRLGWGIVSEMAWMVKAQNPKVKLYVNDYGIVDVGYNAGPYAQQIETLLANGVPIDGIGIQAHRTIPGPIDNTPYMVQRNLDRFERFALPIKITEALFAYDTDERRAAELRKLFPIYFAHPRVEAILVWGFWEKPHWIPYSAMWKTDFTPTKQAEAYRDLVFREWWTTTTATADRNGEVRTRAFYGDYVITAGGRRREVSLRKAEGKLDVAF